jgi:hypothetical protein
MGQNVPGRIVLLKGLLQNDFLIKSVLQQPPQIVDKSSILLELPGGYEILFQDAAPA